jgi:hypothetical protein
MRFIAPLIASLLVSPFANAVETTEQARAYVEQHKDDKMPDGFMLPLSICRIHNDDSDCIAYQAMLLRDMKKAYEGDYQGQRNLAYCLTTGCDGALQPNTILGFAWRIVIVLSGSPKVESGDVQHYDDGAKNLNVAGLQAGCAQAEKLFETVYQKPIPHRCDFHLSITPPMR